jgi:hypothetical protein
MHFQDILVFLLLIPDGYKFIYQIKTNKFCQGYFASDSIMTKVLVYEAYIPLAKANGN